VGYLSDNLAPGRSVADCPELYPYAMVVEYSRNDPFFAPGPVDQLSLAIREALPDVEVWQRSIVRPDENRVKFRFRSEGERTQGSNALTSVDPSISIRRIVFQNPPDRARRGIP